MDYDVFYHGTIIANVKGTSLANATETARAIYGPEVVVEKTRTS